MNLNENQSWLIHKAELEDGCFVSAGGLTDALKQTGEEASASLHLKKLAELEHLASDECAKVPESV